MKAADRRTIAVFEYQRVLLGSTLRTKAGESLTLTEQLFDRLLRVNEQQPQRFLEAGHRSLRFLSRVGVVQVDGVTFEILPKVDRPTDGADAEAKWHGVLVEMLCIARHVPIHSGRHGMLELRERDLLSVFMLLFVDQVDRLVREGLARSYRGNQANLRQFRGRLLVKDHLRENLLHRERFFTAHTIFDEDNAANATLREALVAVSRCANEGEIADRSRRLLAIFPELKPRRRGLSLLPHTRSLARYTDALTLARWILDHFVPSPTGGTDHAFVYLVDMNVLFQEFVATMLKRLTSPTLQVACQARRAFWPEEQTSRRGLKPDLVVTNSVGNLVIDTKWKAHGTKAPSDEDLRQVYVYCEYFEAKRGVLLYPKASSSPPVKSGTFLKRPVRCELQYLDLFNASGDFDPAGVRKQLLELTSPK